MWTTPVLSNSFRSMYAPQILLTTVACSLLYQHSAMTSLQIHSVQCAVGDAFLGKVRENDDIFERQDFLVGDVSSHAPWMLDARRHHAQKMNQPVAEDVLHSLKPKAEPKIVEITPAEEERQRGWHGRRYNIVCRSCMV